MRLLIISHVRPFPGAMGQQLRLRHMLEAALREFDVDFLTYASAAYKEEVARRLSATGCRPLVLDSRFSRGGIKGFARLLASGIFVLRTGMKSSNYTIGKIELSPARIRQMADPRHYTAVLYEYFHAVDSVLMFRNAGVPAILDMHNVLWKSREQRLKEKTIWPVWLRRAWLNSYRRREESSWDQFDALVAINRTEYDLVNRRRRPGQELFYAPMGADLANWPYSWRPASPPRLSYYGALGNPHNREAALRCHDQIMPRVWKKFPNAELWLVGSGPSEQLRRLASDPRVKVTGYVEGIQDVLRSMSLVLCPWSGTYGFRSRIVEVMALGVPLVATPSAVDGMELKSGRGIILAESDDAISQSAMDLLSEPAQLETQSRLARAEMERLYDLEKTYSRFMGELREWLAGRESHETVCSA
jgi:glycosyltransferase involved in cell wall biosynthesis